MSQFIIGITGSFGSGCSHCAEVLSQGGFEYISLSKILEQKATELNLPFTAREDKQKAGDKLRRDSGKEALIKEAEKGFGNKEKIVLECLRNDGEVDYLKARYPNFYLIAVYAGKVVRWERTKGKYKGYENDFDEDDSRDQEEDDPFGQQIKKCVALADLVILNNQQWQTPKDIEDFNNKLEGYVGLLQTPNRSPTQSELNMHVAYSMSLMSSCIQRQVGAVITTQDYGKILSWGYNEVPKHSVPCIIEYTNCYRAWNKAKSFRSLGIKFCPFCGIQISDTAVNNSQLSQDKVDIIETKDDRKVICKGCREDIYKAFNKGKELDLCRALHAEENAILQNSLVGGGYSLIGTVLYSTTFPCFLCAKKIVNVGIGEVVYVEPYPIIQAMELLKDSGVTITEFEGVKAHAFFKIFRERISVASSQVKPLLTE
jgi:deoxycytidylate deaminase/cytidylate kinase